jgi:hypothetical protein
MFYLEKTLHVIGYVAHDQNASINHANELYTWTWRILAYTLEMPRDHPSLVQHSQYHTQAWRANGDISLILSKNGPENPSVDEIIAVEKYITGYACKGNEPTVAIADLFNDMVNCSDENSGSTTKSLYTKLLMGTVKRDISAVETSFELSSLPLYRSSHTFQNLSLTGARILKSNGLTVTKSTPFGPMKGDLLASLT